MTTQPIGSARLVTQRVHTQPAGRYAIAIPLTAENGTPLYDVYFSDSQRTETHVRRKNLQRLKAAGYTVVVEAVPNQPEHTL